jgi:hypothetical protein
MNVPDPAPGLPWSPPERVEPVDRLGPNLGIADRLAGFGIALLAMNVVFCD